MLSIERARALLSYNRDTGEVITKLPRIACPAGTKIGTAHQSKSGHWYYNARVNYTSYGLHRLIWFLETGDWPESVDHINGNGLDNRWVNLRGGSQILNMRNMRKNKRNSSGITGVYSPSGRPGYYQAYINSPSSGKRKHLYYGKDLFEACCRRRSAELEYGYIYNSKH